MCVCTICKHDPTINSGARRLRRSAARAKLTGRHTCPACLDIKFLVTQISETRAFLEHLEAHLPALSSTYNHAHDLFTHRLPPEILAHVFTFSASDEADDSVVSSRLLLGSVCQRWRQIAWAAPQLWTKVHVNLNKFQERMTIRGGLLHEWIARARKMPLSIRVSCDETGPGLNRDLHQIPAHHVLGILNQVSSRWQDLDLSMPFSLFSVLCGSGDGRSILKALRIASTEHNEGNEAQEYNDQLFKMDKIYPLPDRVSLTNIPFNSVHIDWAHVTEVRLDKTTVVDCLCLLQRAPCIEKCSLDIEHDGDTMHLGSPIIHPSIIVLTLSFDDSDGSEALLPHLSLPELREVSYTSPGPQFDSFISLLQRSCSPIITLSLTTWFDGDFESFWELLWTTTSLENVTLKMPHLPLPFFSSLRVQVPHSHYDSQSSADDTIFLPNLRSLSCSTRDPPLSWAPFIDAAESRLRAAELKEGKPLPIPSFVFALEVDEETPYTKIDEVIAARFSLLINRGLKVEITDGLDNILLCAMRRYERQRFGQGNEEGESDNSDEG